MKIHVEKLIELLSQNTPSGKEKETRDYVVRELQELGFTTKVDLAGNVYGVRGKAHKYPLLNAHMDIVDDWGFGYSRAVSRSKTRYSWNDYGSIYTSGSYASVYDEQDYTTQLKSDLIVGYCKELDEMCTDLIEDGSQTEEVNLELRQVQEQAKAYCKKALYNWTTEKEMDRLTKDMSELLWDVDADLAETFDIELRELKAEFVETEAEEKGFEVLYDERTQMIKGTGGRVLGGDDKCGIFIALTVLENLRDLPCKVLFTVEEEIGCLGVEAFVTHKEGINFLKDVGYSLTIDRKGGADLLHQQIGTRSCTWEFAGKLAYHGIREAIPVTMNNGNYADVVTLRDFVPNSVNMSAGYYDAHTEDEYVRFDEVIKIISWVRNILKDEALLHLKGYRPMSKELILAPAKKKKGGKKHGKTK